MENIDWRKQLDFRFAEGWLPYIRCGNGWKDIILDLVKAIDLLGIEWKIFQIKEKFGLLRTYFTWPEGIDSKIEEELDELILAAETKSSITCEECGKSGEMRNGSWLQVLCDSCNEQRIDINLPH